MLPSRPPFNAIGWDGREREVALRILELFGVVERERKLFLSYRRADTEDIAQQLRSALSERRYDVFLDRFSVPPADDFQERLDIELSDKAFVLLLESPSAVGSPWVQHEVTYALSHLISVLALTMPETTADGQFQVIDEAFRLRLDDGDVVMESGKRLLSDAAVSRILAEVETLIARQIRRRLAQLLGSTNDWLFQAGYTATPLAEWSIIAQGVERQLDWPVATTRMAG